MYCSNCGAQSPDDARFCASCGHRLDPITSPTPTNTGESVAVPDPKGSAEFKPVETKKRSILRQIVLVFLWLAVASGSFSFIMLTLGESPTRYQLGTSLFLGYGFLAAMYARRLKILWFFIGGVGAVLFFGVLDGLIRRAIHGLPLFT